MKDFVHLHVHTQHSIGKSIIKFEPLFLRLKELGMRACACYWHPARKPLCPQETFLSELNESLVK